MQNLTKPTKTMDVTRNWHVIDVNNEILGRSATKIAELLMGKSKPYFAKNIDCGDYVIVTNSKNVKVTGAKEKNKLYTNYSGYPGGLRTRRLEEVRAQKPNEVIRHAVSGMLPKNKLRAQMLKRLYVFADQNHPYTDKINN